MIRHPPLEEPWEYFVVIAVRNDRGEEVARQVVNVGALQGAEKRTFALSVEMLPPQAAAGGGSTKVPASPAKVQPGSTPSRAPGGAPQPRGRRAAEP